MKIEQMNPKYFTDYYQIDLDPGDIITINGIQYRIDMMPDDVDPYIMAYKIAEGEAK
jgi:hypothetical protein